MAKTLGSAGRYLAEQTITKSQRMVSFVVLGAFFCGGVIGVLSTLTFRHTVPGWWGLLIPAGFAGLFAGVKKSEHLVDTMGKERMRLRQGLDAEALVGQELGRLSDDYHVIHDVGTGYGNVDHVVVGPTGVFLLETKSCRGTITADGQGELLLNGGKTASPHVGILTGRVMDMRRRIRALLPGFDGFFRGVFVFTAAKVQALFGETGDAHCVRDTGIVEYLSGEKVPKRLKTDEIEDLAKAFAALARMEDGFEA